MKVLSLVDRQTGEIRSLVVDKVDGATILPIVYQNVARETRMMTDEARWYDPLGLNFADHPTVEHGRGEYDRGGAHTNTLEGYFSIFERGIKGIYQHCGTCTATSPSSISAIPTASRSGSTTSSAPA